MSAAAAKRVVLCAALWAVVAWLYAVTALRRACAWALRWVRGEPPIGQYELKRPIRRVCVIGGGAAGIASAKALCEEAESAAEGGERWHVDVYEASGELGGLWRYTPTVDASCDIARSQISTGAADSVGVSSSSASAYVSACYRSLTSNLSACAMSFSDYPLPADPDAEIPHANVLRYLEQYAEHFELERRCTILLRHRVLDVSRNNDGGWAVRFQKLAPSGEAHAPARVDYDAVVVATGHYGKPFVPDVPGLDTFRGRLMHSQSYRTNESMAGERVLVVGCGPSGGELAADIAQRAEHVVISSREGFFPLAKRDPASGLPMDYQLSRLMNMLLPPRLLALATGLLMRQLRQQMAQIGVPCPPDDGRSFQEHTLTITAGLWRKLREGRVTVVRGGIERVAGEQVFFKDGSMQCFDSIVLCTGYRQDLAFVGEPASAVAEGSSRGLAAWGAAELSAAETPVFDALRVDPLYELVFFARDPTLAFVGLPTSTFVFPMCECQARWIARVWSGRAALPSCASMLRSRLQEIEELRARGAAQRMYHRRDPIGYNDTVMGQAGLMPCLLRHPSLLPELLLGPYCAATYRLGEQYDEARRALLEFARRPAQCSAARGRAKDGGA